MKYEGHPDQKLGHITYSENGEDLMILNLCKLLKIDQPSYLDIGAHHPWNISNTALFYQMGSRGVNIEANPNLMEAFHKERTLDKNVNIGVGPLEGELPFFMVDDFSGLNSFSEKSIELHGFKPKSTKMIQVRTISQIVNEYCDGKYPDILLTDLEGLDLSVLKSTDFSRSKPKIICSEIRQAQVTEARIVMQKKRYFPLCRMGENMIFVQNEHSPYCS